MKHARLVMFVTLTGCAYGVADELPSEPEDPPQKPGPYVNREENGGDTLPCDRREVVTFVVNGRTIRFEIPSLCDPTPYIEKGDPAPWNQRSRSL